MPGKAGHEVELVTHEQHGLPTLGEATEQLEDGHLVADIEKCCGLIEDDGRAALGKCPRNAHALPLTTRQLVDVSLEELRRPRDVDGVRHSGAIIGGDVAPHAEVRIATERNVIPHCQRKG